MAGLEADTSSYNSQPLPVSPLDMAGKLGSLQQQSQQIQSGAIQIDKQKLDLMNTQFGLINAELSGMIDNPNITKEQAAERLNKFADTYKLPKEARDHMMGELQAAPSVKAFSENALRRGMTTQERLNQQYGTTESQADGTQVYQGVRAPAAKGGGFTPSTQMPVQIPPGTVGFDQNNQQQFVPPAGPSGVVPVPRPRLPVEPMPRPTTGPTGSTIDRTPETPTTFANRSSPLTAGPSPLFEEGKKKLSEDQLLASQRMTNIKPAIEGLKLLPGLRSGPGTEPWNKAVAFLKANNLIDTDKENDPTAIYQMANKYFNQYLKGRGGRSDADLAAAEKSSPNVGQQLNPALEKLTKAAVAQDMIEAARPSAFTKSGRTDYHNYGEHQSTFPQSVDQRAFEAAIMPSEERAKIVDIMHNKYKKNPNDKEALKFFRSLDIAKKSGMFEGE